MNRNDKQQINNNNAAKFYGHDEKQFVFLLFVEYYHRTSSSLFTNAQEKTEPLTDTKWSNFRVIEVKM